MKKAELVFVPSPGMGHLLAAGKLAKLIVQRHPCISVVVLIITDPHDESSSVTAYVDCQSRDDEVDPSRLSFVALPGPPPPDDPATIPNSFIAILELHKPLVKRAILDRVQSGPCELAGFIVDMFCTPFIDVANDLQVPSFVLFTSGGNGLSLFLHLQSLADDDGVNVPEEFSDLDKELDVPGFRNRVPAKVLPAVMLDKAGGSEMMLYHGRRFRESKGILVNTYTELEQYSIQSLLKQAEENTIPAVYPVGPILELDNKSRCGSQKEEHDSIMEWLNQQPPNSVVFLCFGSMGSFDEVQIKEIANGLERAGHRFLWSLRKPPSESKGIPSPHDETFKDALPEGFMEKTAHRGKIIGWAPQVAILAHHAVGGFVSHCGWNSTLESLWFGVPMATWPMYAEQQVNAFEMVKELGLAVEIKIDYRRDPVTGQGNSLVTAEDIEAAVKKLMSMDEEMREKARELSDKGRKTLQNGGSSHYWLGRFIADVLNNVA